MRKDSEFHTVYIISQKQKLFNFIQGCLFILLISYVFYESIQGSIFLLPILFFYIRKSRRKLKKELKFQLSLQFRDFIMSVSAGIHAGYSVENAWKEAYEEMRMVYGNESMIVREVFIMLAGIENNRSLESLLYDFGKKSEVDEIREFAEVFAIAKRSGGDMGKIIRTCASMINDKVEVKRAIHIAVHGKKFESQLMNAIPFIIILYISLSTPGFFDELYHNRRGILIMTVCLILYLISYGMAEKIVDIEV